MHDTTLSIIELAIQATDAYGRSDLTARLSDTAARLHHPVVRILVVGEFKQGKSSLVNAMLNAPVCPVDDDVATSVPTAIQYAEEPWARILHEPAADQDEASSEPIGFDQLPLYASEGGNAANHRRLRLVEVGLPRRLLEPGLVLVDTPGVGGLGSAHTATTIAALPMADAVLFVSDASQELTAPELDFLKTAREVCPEVAFVLTKTDFYPEWDRIRGIDEGHLRGIGLEAPVFATSAALRRKAIESDDRELNLESGYPHLIEHVRRIGAAGTGSSLAHAVAETRGVVEQLHTMFAAEKEALEDPQAAAAVVERFSAAKQQAEALRDQAARWQVTLNDGIADLTADFDHALRDRMRRTTREAEESIDAQDPGEIWDEFEAWLQRRVSHDLAQTYLELAARTDELSARVARHFDDGHAPIGVHLDPGGALQTAESIDPRSRIERDTTGLGNRTMTAMKGSYGGFLMFGMLARMAGLAMINPATAVIGVLMGGKAVRDEKERQLTLRRQQAKITTRQFVDDAGFAVGKEMRDALRRVQRELRDHYQSRAEETNRSIAESLAAAKSALQSDGEQRAGRLRDVTAELQRIVALEQQVADVAARVEQGGIP